MCMLMPSSFQEHFASLTDPRSPHAPNQRHELIDILVIAVCAVICGAEGWEDIEEYGKAQAAWFAQLLDLPHGIPGHDTFRRVLARLDPEELTQCFLSLSLSRLNHWLPRGQAYPEVMQGTAEFHHQIADTLLPQADPVFDDAAALDTAVDMLDAQPTLVERLVRPLLLPRELLAAGFLGRHEDRHLRKRERQEAQILQEPAPRRQGIRRRIRNGLIMGAAAIGVAQEEDEKQGVDQQDIFYRVVLFLAAITLPSVQEGLGGGRSVVPSRHGQKGGRRRNGWHGADRRWLLRQWRDHCGRVSLRDAEPLGEGASESGRGHHPGRAGPPAGREGGRESTDSLCSGPSRTSAPAPPGGCRSSGRSA